MTFDELCGTVSGDRVVLTKQVLGYPEGTACLAVDNSTLGQLLVCLEVNPDIRFYVGSDDVELPTPVNVAALNLLHDYKAQGRTIEKGRAVHVIKRVVTGGGAVRGYWVHPTGNHSFIFYVNAGAVGSPFDPPKPEPRPAVMGGLRRKVRF